MRLTDDERATLWDEIERTGGDSLEAAVEAILTARLAEAWDEGYDAGIADDVIRAYPDIGRKPNPYRAALTPEATP